MGSSGGWVARFLTDDSVFGVVELQSVRGVGELDSMRVWRCAPGSGGWARFEGAGP